jgi:hypothetical protein
VRATMETMPLRFGVDGPVMTVHYSWRDKACQELRLRENRPSPSLMPMYVDAYVFLPRDLQSTS